MKKLESVSAICFDLDGTLADPFDDTYDAVLGMLRGLNLPDEDPSAIRDWIGDGADLLIHRVLTRHIDGRVSTTVLNQARALFLSSYLGRKPPKTRLYPGVLACLEGLSQRQFPMICTTDMQTAHANSLLKALGVGHFFTRILGTDAIAAGKPDPDSIYEAAAILAVSPLELLVIGDAVNDIHAARAAGSPVICVDYGYNYGTAIQKARPDTTLDTLAKLPNIIAKPNRFRVSAQGVNTPPVLVGSLRGRAMRPGGGAQFR
ncbi:HAD-IA family hydrolase [Salinivibrio sp. ES.052]|uniref:HAD-IA family hydrolase n=1 Tax=Salinivibrio sp. ES.052 TaxID=1882823 RepID=UPI0009285D2B|nr:HAD-IA family hydrolase [Salinivibrio sp. ES.052]SIO34836.1 phosphoglycolate phosphatase [Salinivibrio sp. ES.052]